MTKPRILLLVDQPAWAYDNAAQALVRHLSDEFEFRIEYVVDSPNLSGWEFDLIHVFFWGESYHHRSVLDPNRVIKEVSSHRWALAEEYGCLSAAEMVERYLADARTVVGTSQRLVKLLAPYREVKLTPNGFESWKYYNRDRRNGSLCIGWAGNANDPCKGLKDILLPAVGGDFDLRLAPGNLNGKEMLDFYNSIDVLCVASTAEGEPLTLIEGMACGCFPVCVDVGIVPELIRHRQNGLIVDRSVSAFQAAFQWCTINADWVREAGRANAEELLSSRTWDVVSTYWRAAFRHAKKAASPTRAHPATKVEAKESRRTWESNLGKDLLERPKRASLAAKLICSLTLPPKGKLIDLGCGHQTLRGLLPQSLTYLPIDYVAKTQDSLVVNLNEKLPEGDYDVAAMLGLLEYMIDPHSCLTWASQHSNFLVFSYNDCSDPVRCASQHWESRSTFEEIENQISTDGGVILDKLDLGKGEFLYLISFRQRQILFSTDAPTHQHRAKKVALFSAAVNGDNSGDSLIVDAIQRLLPTHSTEVFPLLQPLTEEELVRINSCDVSIICGTNLYQHRFCCCFTPDTIARINVPIVPLGIGTSAPIGQIPTMDPEGVRAVQMLHERCSVGSVRDFLSLRFVRGLGIKNVELTGCPVLFHSLQEPRFEEIPGERIYLSLRARLLHVENKWTSKANKTLDVLCRQFKPTLVLQSPYDLSIALKLVRNHGLEYVLDEHFLHGPLVQAVFEETRSVGFRLHFGMLSLSYGKPTTLIATDSRTSEFCNMMGIPYHDIHSYSDEEIICELHTSFAETAGFLQSWRSLCTTMERVLRDNGLDNALTAWTSQEIRTRPIEKEYA